MEDKTFDARLARRRRVAVAILAVVILLGTAAALIWSVAPQREVRSAPARKRSPTITISIGGIVQTADGKPAPGVRVSLSSYQNPSVFQLDGGVTGKTVLTQADGKFSFETREALEGFIASGSAGYGAVNIANLNRPDTIILKPWGRVEGIVKRGPKPLSNSQITLSYALAIPGRRQSFVQSAFDTTTDADGKFHLDRVPEGIMRLGLAPRDGRANAHQKEIIVTSGATATIDFGGKGRPVIGKLDPSVASDSRQVTLVPDIPYPFAGRDFSKLSGSDLIAAQHELANSPQYSAWVDARRNSVIGDVEADGTFRFEEVVAGKYRLLADYSSLSKASNNAPSSSEQIATTRSSVTVDLIPDGASDQPLDLGSIPLKVVKRLAIGQSVPDFVATNSGGKAVVKLSEFKGRYVLLLFSPTDARGVERNSAVRFGGVFDRFHSDPRLVMLVVHTGRDAQDVATESAKAGVRWRSAYIEDADSVPEEYAGSSRMLLLIDASHTLLARTLDPLTAFGAVERALAPNGQFTPAQIPGGTVESERVITSVAYGGKDYVKVPPPSSSDAGQAAEFTSVAGRLSTPNQSFDCLHDGFIQSSPDDLNNSFFYDPASVEGRLKIDLGKPIIVARVNSYSWHKDDRAPQVYVLYASTGTPANFDASPAAGIDPATCGWTALAEVDTRPLGRGGRHAVSITRNNSDLGAYRYLLLEIFPTETRDKFGGTFYGEIDVIEKQTQ